MLEAAGIDRILTMDLHSGQTQGFFQSAHHMTALFMLTQYFADLGLEDLVVVAPDAGRVKLNKRFASKIGADLAILNKERPAQQVAEINDVIGDVAGKTAVIVDDLIDTAGTLKAAAEAIQTPARGASMPPRPTVCSLEMRGRTLRPRDLSRSSSPTRCRCRRMRRTTSASSRARTCSPTRFVVASPTAR